LAPDGVRLLASAVDSRQVQLSHHVHHEMRQVVIGQPFRRRWRQQERLFRGVRPVRFRHTPKKSQTAVAVDPLCASGVPSEARYARCPMRNTLLALRIPCVPVAAGLPTGGPKKEVRLSHDHRADPLGPRWTALGNRPWAIAAYKVVFLKLQRRSTSLRRIICRGCSP